MPTGSIWNIKGKKLFFCLKCISINRCVWTGCSMANEHVVDGTMEDSHRKDSDKLACEVHSGHAGHSN